MWVANIPSGSYGRQATEELPSCSFPLAPTFDHQEIAGREITYISFSGNRCREHSQGMEPPSHSIWAVGKNMEEVNPTTAARAYIEFQFPLSLSRMVAHHISSPSYPALLFHFLEYPDVIFPLMVTEGSNNFHKRTLEEDKGPRHLIFQPLKEIDGSFLKVFIFSKALSH
ncbi:hypothetical protein AVEN_205077-1 [Araneus ventricosus]|uniref:Uncharacterized protein n=1 Tax=Araneus ventricosus TaxID=182803 RepID=A0A4Y2H0M7_ARAVE|nr:hypothetical protein AVEN_205077-1 [Araneus ventricosus]